MDHLWHCRWGANGEAMAGVAGPRGERRDWRNSHKYSSSWPLMETTGREDGGGCRMCMCVREWWQWGGGWTGWGFEAIRWSHSLWGAVGAWERQDVRDLQKSIKGVEALLRGLTGLKDEGVENAGERAEDTGTPHWSSGWKRGEVILWQHWGR